MNKYRNEKTIYNNIKFDSKKEANRYQDLLWLERGKLIKDLELQKRFLLQEDFKWNGKTYKKIEYICDFFYFDIKEKIHVVEDVKSPITKKNPVYLIKKKLFLKRYGKKYFFIDRI